MQKIEYRIIADSREKNNFHIINYLKKNKINYEIRKLDVGDYAIETPDGYRPKIVIERKANLDELIGNLLDKNKNKDAKGDNRFTRELNRAAASGIKIILLIEDNDFYLNILLENYRSMINPNSLRGLLLSLEAKYPNLHLVGMSPTISGNYINNILYYHLREELKQGDK